MVRVEGKEKREYEGVSKGFVWGFRLGADPHTVKGEGEKSK